MKNCNAPENRTTRRLLRIACACLVATVGFAAVTTTAGAQFANRGDIVNLPAPLKARLAPLAGPPHTYDPLTVFAEAPDPSQFFAYYLLDPPGFQPNVFPVTIPEINDGVAPTATGPNGDLPTIASVRLLVEPKPG